MLLHDICVESTLSHPAKAAILCGPASVSYHDLTESARTLAAHWHMRGLKTGDRVALWLPNCPEAIISYLACFQAGFIAVPLDFRYTAAEGLYCIGSTGSSALITVAERWETLRTDQTPPPLLDLLLLAPGAGLPPHILASNKSAPSRPPDVDYLSTIFFTSGTTSRPKGATHTSRRTFNRIEKFIQETNLTSDSASLVATSLMKPMAFQLLAMAILKVGGTAALLPRFSPEAFWNTFFEPPVKTIVGVTPNMLAQLLPHQLAAKAKTHPQATWIVGGDRTPPYLSQQFRSITGGELVETCGMTETGPYAMNPPFGQKKSGSAGVAAIGVLLRIVDAEENDVPTGQTGQVVVRTPDTMIGYWNDTLATYEVLRDGWMRTGDLARADEDGFLWVQGRQKEMIVRDGSNIAPAEVERVAMNTPGIQTAAAIGVDDPPRGQAVHLFLLGDSTVEPALHAALTRELRELARPGKLHWLAEFPQTPGGKLDRLALKRIAAAST